MKVSWTTREGKSKSAVLPRYWSQRQLGFSNQRKGKVAILRIDAFTQTVAVDFSKSLPDVLDGAEVIVLDLRSNGGGDAEAMADIASLFLDDGINLGKFADRSGASFELQTYSKRLWRVPQLGAHQASARSSHQREHVERGRDHGRRVANKRTRARGRQR